MSTNVEQLRLQWRVELTRLAERVDDLQARIDAESRMLYTSLSAEIATLQSDLRILESEVHAAGPDIYGRQIAAQIEELHAKGDAAYNLLQAGRAAQLDPTDAEIRRLEMAASAASEDARAKIKARIDELKSSRAGAQIGGQIGEQIDGQIGGQTDAVAARNTNVADHLPG